MLNEQGINLIKEVTYERVSQDEELKRVHITVDGEKKVVKSEQLLVATEDATLGTQFVL